ncbi:restriction endonuclease [Hamadaea sp. NPDC050747]|uniref:restriction endonuclease n=1 Tax=Hamadaea sp. NPDC050747 TaxID=3155789 RepID=UPI0033F581C5
MKINSLATIKPPKLADARLNHTFGAILGRMSDDDVSALAFRHTEIRVARQLCELWRKHEQFIDESSVPNADYHQQLRQDPRGLASIANDLAAFLHADQNALDNEKCLARAHVMLCEKVVAALAEAFVDGSVAGDYRIGVPRDRSPLRHLQGSADALQRAQQRVGKSNVAWNEVTTRMFKEAEERNVFATTPQSITLDRLDALTPDQFEEWIAYLLERDGCTIERRRGGPNDQGADVIAVTSAGQRVVVQCKHSIKPATCLHPNHLYALHGTAVPIHKAHIVAMVTNRRVSDTARAFAKQQGIHIIDRPQLEKWATYGVSWLPAGSHVLSRAV